MRRQQEAAQGAGKVSDTESDKAVEDSLFWEGPVEQKSDSQRASDPEKSQGQLQRETRQGKGYGMRPLSQMASTLQRSTNWRAGWGGRGRVWRNRVSAARRSAPPSCTRAAQSDLEL